MKGVGSENWGQPLAQADTGVSFGRNVLVRTLCAGTLLALLLCVGVIGYFIHPTGTPIVLHYNVYFGVDLLGVWWQAYALPFLGMLFVIGHFFLARRFYVRTERIASYLMLLSAGMLSGGLLVASISIAFINY